MHIYTHTYIWTCVLYNNFQTISKMEFRKLARTFYSVGKLKSIWSKTQRSPAPSMTHELFLLTLLSWASLGFWECTRHMCLFLLFWQKFQSKVPSLFPNSKFSIALRMFLALSKATLFNRTFCSAGNILYLHCPIK